MGLAQMTMPRGRHPKTKPSSWLARFDAPITTRHASAATAIAVLYLAGGIGCLLGAAFPMSPHAPIGLGQVLGAVGLTFGAGIMIVRTRVTVVSLHSLLVLATVLVSVLVACSKTAAGVLLTGVDYMCIGWISAYFFPRRTARFHCGLAIAGFCSAIAAGGLPGLVVPSLVVVTTVAVSAEMLAHFVTQLRRQAAQDPLTGLANRAFFRAAAEREMALAARGKRVFVLVMLDMDDFKVVNDTRGHLAGDALLIELAQTWQAQLRRSDVLSRFGGDEFALLMPSTTRQQGEQVLARIRAAHPASWSAGTVEWDGDDSFEQMLRRADRNLYEAKANRGRALAAHRRDERARPAGARSHQRAHDGGGEDVGATVTAQQPGTRQPRSQAAM